MACFWTFERRHQAFFEWCDSDLERLLDLIAERRRQAISEVHHVIELYKVALAPGSAPVTTPLQASAPSAFKAMAVTAAGLWEENLNLALEIDELRSTYKPVPSAVLTQQYLSEVQEHMSTIKSSQQELKEKVLSDFVGVAALRFQQSSLSNETAQLNKALKREKPADTLRHVLAESASLRKQYSQEIEVARKRLNALESDQQLLRQRLAFVDGHPDIHSLCDTTPSSPSSGLRTIPLDQCPAIEPATCRSRRDSPSSGLRSVPLDPNQTIGEVPRLMPECFSGPSSCPSSDLRTISLDQCVGTRGPSSSDLRTIVLDQWPVSDSPEPSPCTLQEIGENPFGSMSSRSNQLESHQGSDLHSRRETHVQKLAARFHDCEPLLTGNGQPSSWTTCLGNKGSDPLGKDICARSPVFMLNSISCLSSQKLEKENDPVNIPGVSERNKDSATYQSHVATPVAALEEHAVNNNDMANASALAKDSLSAALEDLQSAKNAMMTSKYSSQAAGPQNHLI